MTRNNCSFGRGVDFVWRLEVEDGSSDSDPGSRFSDMPVASYEVQRPSKRMEASHL